MKKIGIGVLALSLAGLAQAGQLSVAPKAGQWQINTQNYIEGQDIAPRLEGIKRQAAAFLDPKYVAKLDQFDLAEFTQCVSPQQATLLQDPEQGLRVVEQALGQCQLQLDSQTSTSFDFSGQCELSKQGIAGRVAGQIRYLSPTTAEGYVDGVGRFPTHLQLLLLGRLQSELNLRHQFTAQWQQTQCTSK